MPPKRTYSQCVKCGGNSMGRYKDEEGRDLCFDCRPRGKLNRMDTCKNCNKSHYSTREDEYCNRCRKSMNVRTTNGHTCKICKKYSWTSKSHEYCTKCINSTPDIDTNK